MENNDFIIENGVLKKYIGNSAEVTIPDGVTIISSAAFRNCENLKSVTIMNKDVEIGEETINLNVNGEERKYVNNAFEGCENPTIYAPADSTAEQFAKKKQYSFC